MSSFERIREVCNRRKVAVCVLYCMLGICAEARADAALELFVAPNGNDANDGTVSAPVRSIERARDIVRTMNTSMQQDIVVYIRGGTYRLDKTFRLDGRDSGYNGWHVIYRSFPGERAILSGGTILSGWDPIGGGVYKAHVKGIEFRQLYVNGRRAIRARQPNEPEYHRLLSWDEGTSSTVVNSMEVGAWNNLSQVEMVVLKEWTQNNLRIHSVALSGEQAVILPHEPDRRIAFSGHLFLRAEGQSYYFENAHEFLDQEGEWYLDTYSGELFYKARAGEDMTTASVVMPHLEQLMRIEGSTDQPVKHVRMMGLTFEYSTWMAVNTSGFATSQADVLQRENDQVAVIPGMIHIQHASEVEMARNVIRHAGGAGAVLFKGTDKVRLIGNLFTDIAAGGIGVALALDDNSDDLRTVCRNDVIANNYLFQIGRDFASSVGIFAAYVEEITIEHNELVDMPYTGISLGWGWTDKATILRGNSVRANRIHHVMNRMADGAGLYTLSKQPGTVLSENYIYDIVRSPWAGRFPISAIYLDEGSSEILVKNNVLENVPVGIDFHRAHHNNVVNTLGTYQERWESSDNVFQIDDSLSADTVRARSGLEAAYRDVPMLAELQY